MKPTVDQSKSPRNADVQYSRVAFVNEPVKTVVKREALYTVESLRAALPVKNNEAGVRGGFDADAFIARMRSTKGAGEWHAGLYELTGRYVRNGSTDDEMLSLAGRIEQYGYSREQTLADIRTAIAFFRKKEKEKPLTNKRPLKSSPAPSSRTLSPYIGGKAF